MVRSEKTADVLLRKAGWSILLFSLIPLLMWICFMMSGASHYMHDLFLVLISIYVGGQFLRGKKNPVTFGFTSFIFFILYYGLIISCAMLDGKYIRKLHNFFWWDLQTLAVVSSVGFIWSLTNTWFLWRIRSRVRKRESSLTSRWSNLRISSVLILGFLASWSVKLLLTETGLRRYYVQIPRHVTVKRIQLHYPQQLNALKNTIRNYSKQNECRLVFPSPVDGKEFDQVFSPPEILYVDIQTTKRHHTSIYRKHKIKYSGIEGEQLKSKVGLQSPVLNEFMHGDYGEKQRIIIYSDAVKDRDGTIRTYSIYFDAGIMSEKLKG